MKISKEPKQQALHSNLKYKDPLPTTEFQCMGFVKSLFWVCQFILLQHVLLGGALYYYLAYFPQMHEIQKISKDSY